MNKRLMRIESHQAFSIQSKESVIRRPCRSSPSIGHSAITDDQPSAQIFAARASFFAKIFAGVSEFNGVARGAAFATQVQRKKTTHHRRSDGTHRKLRLRQSHGTDGFQRTRGSHFACDSYCRFLVSDACYRHQLAAAERKIFSHAAVAFAIVYAVLTGLVYLVQLTLVAPRLAHGQTAGIEAFLFVPLDSFLYAVGILGYSFMSVATLFAAPVFTGDGLQRIARLLLLANGLLLPFIALQMYFHPLIWIAALWAVTFPSATWTLALLFRRATIASGG